MLAAALADGAGAAPGWTPGYLGGQLALLLLFLLLNGLFVAAEYALLKVRRSELEEKAESGNGYARRVLGIVGNLDGYLAACQLGITVSSILLGMVSGPFLAALLQPALGAAGLGEGWILFISYAAAFSIIVFLHVILGEQLPRVVAVSHPQGTTMACGWLLHLFYQAFRAPLWLLDRTADFLALRVLRLDPASAHRVIHTAEDLQLLVGGAGEVSETERDIVINALELSDLTVRSIMTPRNEVIMLDAQKSFEENLETAIQSKHTRFPLAEGHLDRTLGLVHVKDLLAEARKDAPDLRAITRDILMVPEMTPLDSLLQIFRSRHAHMALVIDEFGGGLGLVMLDDVLEELVGEIQDEFDEEDREFRRLSETEFLVDGTLPLHELAEHEEDLELENPDVSTVGGYITHLLGHLPEPGETVEVEGYECLVTKADERSVHELRFRRLAPPSRGESAGAE